MFLDASRAKCGRPSSSLDTPKRVEIFKFLLALAKQIESFIQGCCKEAWIQAAMTLTNVSEYVPLLGFDLELCQVAFCKECAAGELTLDQIEDINRAELEIVNKKASADVVAHFAKVASELNFLSGENRDLASLLQWLVREFNQVQLLSICQDHLCGL